MPRRIVILAVLAGCATSHGQLVMKLDEGCLGRCNVFDVAVYDDGFVEYHGWRYVKHGRRTDHLAPAQLTALEAAFTRSGFATLDRAAIGCGVDDQGTLVSIRYRGKHLDYFDMCATVPDDLRMLVGEVLDALRVDRWFGTARERAQLPESR